MPELVVVWVFELLAVSSGARREGCFSATRKITDVTATIAASTIITRCDSRRRRC